MLDRRRVLKGSAAAVVAAPGIAHAAANPDAELLAAWSDFDESGLASNGEQMLWKLIQQLEAGGVA